MQLKKRAPGFIQAVDYDQNARELNDAAKEAGVVADVVIDVAVGTRSGIPPGEDAIKLAQLVDKQPGLKLRGMLSYDGGAQHITGFAARKERTLKNIEENARTYEKMKSERPQHRDLQRRRHRHLQHLSPRPGIHRRAGRQLHLHGHAVRRDRQRRRPAGLRRFRAVADGARHGRQQSVPGPPDHRRRRQGADVERAARRRDRRARHGLQRRLGRIRIDHVQGSAQGAGRWARRWSSSCRTAIRS